MVAQNTSIASLIKSFYDNKTLIKQFVRRDIVLRYRGSFLGIMWSLVTPLLMLAIYSFVFTIVFQARWAADTGPKGEFAIILFSGIILHGFFTECICRSPTTILDNTNFVKKVIFPLEILAPITVISALFQLLISFLVLILGVFFIYHSIPVTIIYVPLILFPFILLSFGISWFLASIGVYLRDIIHVTGVLSTILLFMSTIFYPSSRLSEPMQSLIYLNPLSFITDQLRDAVIFGNFPNLFGLFVYLIISIIIFYMGFWWFQRTRTGFSDVI